MDYEQRFRDVIAGLKAEGRYRVFAELERKAGRFPEALRHRLPGEGGGIFRDSSEAKDRAKLYRELEREARSSCGLAH